jgi:hypothetical protein
VSDCGSLIELVIGPEYKGFALLHASLPKGASLIQCHGAGGEILHLFYKGKGKLLRTADSQSTFISTEFDTSTGGWHLIVVDPQELYQVLNEGVEPVEYFFIFVDHQDSRSRGLSRTIDFADLPDKQWAFVNPLQSKV